GDTKNTEAHPPCLRASVAKSRKSQTPNPETRSRALETQRLRGKSCSLCLRVSGGPSLKLGIWHLGFGIWVLGFTESHDPARRRSPAPATRHPACRRCSTCDCGRSSH